MCCINTDGERNGMLKVSSLVLIIDETLGLTLCLRVYLAKVGTHQVVELDDGHGDGDGQNMIKCSSFGKEEREKTKSYGLKAKV